MNEQDTLEVEFDIGDDIDWSEAEDVPDYEEMDYHQDQEDLFLMHNERSSLDQFI